MALSTEIWLNSLIENLYKDNTFAAHSVNHSAFANNLTVHVPNAGAAPSITVDGSSFPAEVAKRVDTDLTYNLSVFRSAPILVQNAEEVELSYDKRNSIIRNSREALTEAVHTKLLSNWVSKVKSTNKVTSATMTKDAILGLKNIFDKQDIPLGGRFIIMTPDACNEILGTLASAEQFAFSQSANAAMGTVGKLFGFDIYMRSVIDTASSNKTSAFAWHQDCVCRALGSVELFEAENDPTYYGDIISAEIRAGGTAVRTDQAGLAKIVTA